MARGKATDPAAAKQKARVLRQVSDIVNEIVLSTADEDVEVAIDKLHARLGRVNGVTFDRTWSKRAVETMRRGDDFKVILPRPR